MIHRRSKRVAVRMNPLERHYLDQLSVFTGLDISDVIRQLIRKERAAYSPRRKAK